MLARTNPSAYLAADLQILDLLLHREILRLRAVYHLSLDEFRGLYVSDEQINQIIDSGLKHQSPNTVTAELTERAEALRYPLEQGREESPWTRLVNEFSLSPTEQNILLLAVAPDIHLKYETLYAYLNNDVTRKWPTCDLALRLFSANSSTEAVIRQCLVPDAPLFHGGLLQWKLARAERTSWRASGFSAAPALLHYLSDISSLDARLTSLAEQRTPEIEWEEVPLSADLRSALRQMVQLFASLPANHQDILGGPMGREGTVRRAAAEAMCRELGMKMLCVDLEDSQRRRSRSSNSSPAIQLQQRREVRPSIWNAAKRCLIKVERLFPRDYVS